MADKQLSQAATIAVIQEQVARVMASTDSNERALRGSDIYVGLIAQMSTMASNLETMATAIDEIQKTVSAIDNRHLCNTCGITELTEIVKAHHAESASYPTILWLLKHRPKETIPLLIVSIVAISMIGHLQFEPLFLILMTGAGVSPAIISALLKAFGK